MPATIKGETTTEPYISITGDSLSIDPGLTPKPNAGVQVRFKFAFDREGGVRRLIGLGSVWDNFSADLEAEDADNYDDLEGLTDLKDLNGEAFGPECFRGLKGSQTLSIDFEQLTRMLLEENYEDLETTLLDEALRAFLASHTVTAEISDMGRCIAVGINFERFGATAFSFHFEAGEEASQKLFTFKEVGCVI